MNRLFIILAAIAGITAAAWAYRQHQNLNPTAAPAPTTPTEETPICCQKSPSRTTLLQAKPTATPATATAAPTR